MKAKGQRFTIYDMMEAKGVFDDNPANTSASPDVGGYQRAEYPKMMYHPKGERRVTVPAEIISTPMGPKEVGQQTEIIHRIVGNAADEKKLLAEGWHNHPAKAIAASGGEAPAMSSDQRIKDLEAQIAALQTEKDLAKAALTPATGAKLVSKSA